MNSLSTKTLKKMVDKLYQSAARSAEAVYDEYHVGEMYELEFMRRSLHQALDQNPVVSKNREDFIQKWMGEVISTRSTSEMLDEYGEMLIRGLFNE